MTAAYILFGCLAAAITWAAVLTVAAKGILRRLDAAELRAALAADVIAAQQAELVRLTNEAAR